MKRKQRADVLSAFPGFAKMMLLLALLLWGGVQAKASSDSILQQSERTISGLVTDESGEPLIGVTVMVKGTRVGTTTNLDGVFTLKIPTNAGILQFSYMGMKTTELSIGSKSQFKVAMESDAVLIDDVVVIGYGTRSKKDMSISVSSVKGDELNNRPSAFNIMQSVAGKVAGVQNISMSGRPGGSSSLRVRGMGSINAGKDPIYVLDGVIGVDPDIINAANGGWHRGNGAFILSFFRFTILIHLFEYSHKNDTCYQEKFQKIFHCVSLLISNLPKLRILSGSG